MGDSCKGGRVVSLRDWRARCLCQNGFDLAATCEPCRSARKKHLHHCHVKVQAHSGYAVLAGNARAGLAGAVNYLLALLVFVALDGVLTSGL